MEQTRDNNPWYPLSPQYPILGPEEQRVERLAVLTDQDTPEKLVRAWELFRMLYLRPQGEGFYPKGFVESPQFHYQAVHDLGQYARNGMAAPRGFAKSTVLGTEIPIFLLLTRAYFRLTLCLSTDRLVEERFAVIMKQLTENPLILADFGEMKPKRGGAEVWNHHTIHLMNGSRMNGVAVMGRKRGGRPDLFLLDDPEFDPEAQNNEAKQVLLDKFYNFMFREVIPMLEYGSAIFWIGTIINKRTALYQCVYGRDARFDYWNRRLYKAITYDPKAVGKAKSLWEGKYTKEFLDVRRAEIGPAAWAAEYMNEPVSESDRLLVIHPQLNEYTVKNLNLDIFTDTSGESPIQQNTEVEWVDKDPASGLLVPRVKSMQDHFGKMYKIMVVDYAYSLSSSADFKAIGVFGFDSSNCLWILEMWAKRTADSELMRHIFRLGMKWRVKVIGLEACAGQVSLPDAASTYLAEHPRDGMDWNPRIMPIKYPANTSKADRIAAQQWRYGSGKIKYPRHLREIFPYTMLYDQTQDFTQDLSMLEHDDMIDLIGMTNYVVHSRGAKDKAADRPLSIAQRILKNIPIVKGLPILSGVNADELSQEDVDALMQKVYTTGNLTRSRSRRYVHR
jgi:hypothetical protein